MASASAWLTSQKRRRAEDRHAAPVSRTAEPAQFHAGPPTSLYRQRTGGRAWHPWGMPAGRRTRSWSLLVAMVSTAVLVAGATVARAAIDMTPIRRVSAPSSWTVGNAMGRSDAYLHTVWASDCPPPRGACATDGGPYVGVFWQRSTIASPANWSSARRLSLAGHHAARPSVAAAGTHVYVTWVTQRSYLKYLPKAPRRVWIRVAAPVSATGVDHEPPCWLPTRIHTRRGAFGRYFR